MPLVRQRSQCFRQYLKIFDPNCWFSRLRDKTLPFHTEKIANIHQLKYSGLFHRQLFQTDVDLKATTHIAKIKELALAHIAMRRDPARHTDPCAFRKGMQDFTDLARNIEPTRERIRLPLMQLLQLLTAEGKKIVFFHGTLD
jgi:hypothetical protein